MSQLEMLRNKCRKWGGEVRNISTDYASGTATIHIHKAGQSYAFPFKAKNTTKAIEVLSWSIRNLISCDERGILPFVNTAHEYLQISGSTEPFVEAEEKYFVTLGLTSKVSNHEIIKAYKQIAKDLHPDTFVGLSEALRKDAEAKFSEMTHAYSEIKKARRF